MFGNGSKDGFAETVNIRAQQAPPNLPSEPNHGASDHSQARDFTPDLYVTRPGRVSKKSGRITCY